MTRMMKETERCREARTVYVADRPMPFTKFIDGANGLDVELVDGVVVERTMVPFDHEECSGWLYHVLALFAKRKRLGIVASSRIMVRVDDFGGRMPDLLFVKQARRKIIKPKGVYGAPDLVIEIASQYDRPSDLRALEADYIRLGVPEILFINLIKNTIRLLQISESDGHVEYNERTVSSGPIEFKSMDGLVLQAEWILSEPRPDEFELLTELLESNSSE